MKRGELIILNGIFSSKMKLPQMKGDDLYALLSAKADISALAKETEDKAETLRLGVKPETVDEFNADPSDPDVKEWIAKYVPMQNRLYNEEQPGTLPEPCINRTDFPKMCEGLTPGEAELVMNYLVKG